MLPKGTYARTAPMLLKDYLKTLSLRIVLKDVPPGVVSLNNVLTTFP